MPLYPATVDADSPLAHWRFGERPASATAVDRVGGKNLTWNGSPASLGLAGAIAGDNDASAYLDGTNDYGANASLTIPIGSPLTVMLWAYVPSSAAGVQRGVWEATSAGDRSAIVLPFSDGNVYFDHGVTGGNSTTTGRVSVAFDAGWYDRWTHWAFVTAGAGATFKGIYVDGALVASAATSAGNAAALVGVTVGRTTTFGGNHFYMGGLDEVSVYPSVLSAVRITAHYNAGHYGRAPRIIAPNGNRVLSAA